MRPFLFAFSCLLALTLQASPRSLQDDSTQIIRSNNPLSTHTDSLVDKIARDYFKGYPQAVGLSIGVSEQGGRKYYGYGRTRLTGDDLPDSNTLFEIGSVTKTFTSLLLAQAVVARRISLDEPVKKYLPESLQLSKGGKEISFRQLAGHSSGLPRMMSNFGKAPGFDPMNPYKTYTRALLLEYLRSNAPIDTPGVRYEYSNLGAAVLGLAMETVDGQPYAVLVREKILLPFNMHRTFLDVPQTERASLADGHFQNGKLTSHWDFDCIAPAGAIKSSAVDMLAYLEINMAEKDPALILSHQPSVTVNPNLSVGLGWHILTPRSGKMIVWHNGGTGGFSSFAGFIKEERIAVIVLANNGKLNAADPIGVNILRQLIHQ